MTIRLHKGVIVSVLHKTGPDKNGRVTCNVIAVELDPRNTSPTEKWRCIGEPFHVDSQDIRRRESPE